MAIYIRRDRLGSNSDANERLKRAVESRQDFRIMQDALSKANAKRQKQIANSYDENAEVQRRRAMSSDERAVDAIETMIPTTKAVQEARTGKECSHEDARKVAENIAYKGERKKKGE